MKCTLKRRMNCLKDKERERENVVVLLVWYLFESKIPLSTFFTHEELKIIWLVTIKSSIIWFHFWKRFEEHYDEKWNKKRNRRSCEENVNSFIIFVKQTVEDLRMEVVLSSLDKKENSWILKQKEIRTTRGNIVWFLCSFHH